MQTPPRLTMHTDASTYLILGFLGVAFPTAIMPIILTGIAVNSILRTVKGSEHKFPDTDLVN